MVQANENDAVWVSPQAGDDELGTREHPFADVGRAMLHARPGWTVVLMDGEYAGDCTIQQSGTEMAPIRIMAENRGHAVVVGSCWYLYDVSDVLVSGIVFRDAPAGALSVVGACSRNCFSELVFVNCSRLKRPACTLFFGGSGAQCNVVQDCEFIQDTAEPPDQLGVDRASVALILSEGDAEGGSPNTDFVVQRTTVRNYGYGVMVGSRDKSEGHYGHMVEYNTFDGCGGDAIVVKCGDTTVRGNRVLRAGGSGVAVLAGSSSTVSENRITDCGNGVRVCGDAHTVAGNCIVRCRSQGIHVAGDFRPDLAAASAILIERNTLVDCGSPSKPDAVTGILSDPGTSCVVEKNLFAGAGLPYLSDESGSSAPRDELADMPSFFSDNVALPGTGQAPGCRTLDIPFAARERGDCTNESGYGASGWVLSPDAPQVPAEDDVAPEEYRLGMAEGAERASEADEEIDRFVEEMDESEPLSSEYFFPDGDDLRGEEQLS